MDPLIKKMRITRVIKETPEAKTFVLDSPDNWQPVYQAGQFLTLVFNTPFGEKRRSYSVSSAPLLNEPLSITVKRMTNGEFSRQLIDHAREGDLLLTTGTSGFFRLPENMQNFRQFFFLAAGSGITPCFSLIKTLLFTTDKTVVLLYSNRSPADTIFHDQLLQWMEEFPGRFTCRFLFSTSTQLEQGRLSSWLLEKFLQQYISGSPAEALFYLCGPFPYMQAVTITLLINGVPQENIKKENFDSSPRKVHPVPPDTDSHLVKIRIAGKEYALTVQYPQSIIQAAKAQNIQLPYSCEAGRCGSCIATCTSGKTWMAYNEVLTENEVAEGRVLTCQAYPIKGDAEISFDT